MFGVEGFGCPQCSEVMMLRIRSRVKVLQKEETYEPKVGESPNEERNRTVVSVLPPLAITLLGAMNWRGPPMWVGFTDL